MRSLFGVLVFSCLLTLSTCLVAGVLHRWAYGPEIYAIIGHSSMLITFSLCAPLSVVMAVWLRRIMIMNDRLAEDRAHDELTGAKTRRELELQKDHITEADGLIAMIDVDEFKQVNTALGHGGGDRVLCNVAKILKKHARAEDQIFRVGGDEFLMFIPRSRAKNGQEIFDRLRIAVADAYLRQSRKTAVHVTLSIGWIYKPAGARLARYLEAADLALFDAKNSGRNKTVRARAIASDANPRPNGPRNLGAATHPFREEPEPEHLPAEGASA